jgi:hypothetical protein
MLCLMGPGICQYLTDTNTMCEWNNLMHTENNDEIIKDNCGTDAPKLRENWLLTLR